MAASNRRVEWMVITALTEAIDAEFNMKEQAVLDEMHAKLRALRAERTEAVARRHANNPHVAERNELIANVIRLNAWGKHKLIRLATTDEHGHEYSIYGGAGGFTYRGGKLDGKNRSDCAPAWAHVLTPALWIGSFTITCSVGEGDAPEIAGWKCVGVERSPHWPANVRTYVRAE